MKRWVLLAGILTASILPVTGGCGDGMAASYRDRQERQRRIAKSDAKQFNDDWDTFWLNDEMGHLSRWRIR